MTPTEILANGRDLAAPFWLQCDDVVGLQCEQILRLQPGRRLVCRARFDDMAVVVKLFVGAKARRDYQRERRGLQAATASGVPTAPIVVSAPLGGAACYLLFRYLDGEGDAPVEALAQTLARLHQGGARHQDPHADNFLAHDGQTYLVDGGAVVPTSQKPLGRKRSLKNLALLAAEIDPCAVTRLTDSYERERQWLLSPAEHKRLLGWMLGERERRLIRYLRKTLRECSQFHCVDRWNRFVVVDRADVDLPLLALLEHPDQSMACGRMLKAGNTATVVSLAADRRRLVIKRYNNKGWAHALRRNVRTSRARRSWLNHHRLCCLGIATARPVAVVEDKIGRFVKTAYLVTEEVDGCHLLGFVEQNGFDDELLTQVVELFARLRAARLVHGDMKATNVLIDTAGRLHLVDLDAMKKVAGSRAFEAGFKRDVQRFLDNWPGTDAVSVLRRRLEAVGG